MQKLTEAVKNWLWMTRFLYGLLIKGQYFCSSITPSFVMSYKHNSDSHVYLPDDQYIKKNAYSN